jgi:23S rRNA (pseudouridine1915-N3)-methyltransferase
LPFVKEGIQYYLKKLRYFAGVEIIETKGTGERLPQELLQKVSGIKPYVLLDAGGRLLSSEDFAELLDRALQWNFVLGGAYGVPEQLRHQAQMLLSLSPMTMPHELVRVVFLEQLYRAMSIINKSGYHH